MTIFNYSLDIDKPPEKTRVVVAMSGGVDSSVTAALLKEAGYDVVGMTMQLYDHGEVVARKACCAGIDIYDARTVADQIGIPHYVLNYESRFKNAVMEDFAESYIRGETPIPCIKCNETVKFRDMFQQAKDLGADVLATGHYLQRRKSPHGSVMERAIDPTRDQSYFLFSTTHQQLNFLRFPLGHLMKSETRQHAHRLGLRIADKPDSQDICFVPNGNYAHIVEKLRPGAGNPGHIVDFYGNVLGTHQGIINFTIGQRRGLNVGGTSEPLYVIALRPQRQEVVVGPKQALARTQIIIKDLNWLVHAEEDINLDSLTVKIRSTQPPLPASVTLDPSHKGAVATLKSPEYGVSNGQACVIYDGNRVLGGGWIKSSN